MSFSKYLKTTPETMVEYKSQLTALKQKYKGEIEVFCGVEAEILSENNLSGYDYIIGSAHYMKIGDEYVGFDRDAKTVGNIINKYFDGDGMKYAKAYYELVSQIPERINADILGHFDLISKHSETNNFFNTASKKYLSYAFDAIDALSDKVPFFEINTGAIARGYRTTPYPAIPLLKRLLEKGFLPIITSDCHNKAQLDCAFELAINILEDCGVKESYVFTGNGFKEVGLR